jgi:glycosyltransferase involved in cell wall biosynthesis
MHKISVVIPLYNKVSEIERCLHSVIGQSLSPLEILVIDDGCTDASARKVAGSSDERVRLIQQTNQGASAARNRGIGEATGDWVAFLDADDEWKPEFLATVTGLMERFPSAALCATGCDIIEDEDRVVEQHYEGLPAGPVGGLMEDFFASMTRYPPINSSNSVCKQTVFDEVGLFPLGEALAEDWDMWTRIALRHPIAYDPAIQAVYHTGAANRAARDLTFSGNDTALLTTLQNALEKGDFRHTRRDSVEAFMAKHLLEIAKHLIAAGNRSAARARIRQAWPLHGARRKCVRWWIKSLQPTAYSL